MTRMLFLLKRREFSETSDPETYSLSRSSGLLNSVTFIVDMLRERGCDAILEECFDNNCIDRLITKHRPTHVILEALWVVPSKVQLLTQLHPKVNWVVRLHSDVPFIANEGIACEWLYAYRYLGVEITANSRRMQRAAKIMLGTQVTYSPNYYPVDRRGPWRFSLPEEPWHALKVGCFGAVRPLKNHLIQAKAAIAYADSVGRTLFFHINSSRTEGNGSPVLKNLRALFDGSPRHFLVEHVWLNHKQFKQLVSKMDLVMQVSFTETFNIVAADAVNLGVPVVTSNEIRFVCPPFTASPVKIDSIRRAIAVTITASRFRLHEINRFLLKCNVARAARAWDRLVRHFEDDV